MSRAPASGPGVRIRLAAPGDLDAVGELTVAGYAGFTDGPADPYVARLRDAASRARGAELWLAEDGDLPLGTVTSCPAGSAWREISEPDEGEFRMLAVAPQARGRGVGEALVRHCIERSRDAGDRGMVLSSLPQMTAAHRLYARLGFSRLPARDWSPVPGVDLLAFRLGY